MSEAGPRVNGPASPTGKYIDGIDPDDPAYIKNLQRPAEVKEDLQQMENRSRVSIILNSQAFKDELEQVVEEQLRNGPYPASLIALQQITDLLLPQSKGGLGSLARASSVIPINDIRGVESLSFVKGEKLLRCKVASLYRLVDLCGWSHGIHNHISARVSPESEHFLLNPFGLTYSEITASSLVKVDVNGDIVEPGSTHLGVYRTGFSVHSAIHQARPDIKCIVHLQTPSAVAVSALKCGLLAMSQEALICGNISYHDFHGVAVDADERERLARNLGVHNKILILRNRGVLACGESVEEAFHFTFNVMAACEAQVKAMPIGLDNIVIPSAAAREQTHRVANQGGGGVDTTGRKWKIGELEFEALMRTLDNSGFRTGHVYKMPVVKQERKERSNSEVEIPPASSSFTYIFDGDYEHSKYASPVKAAMERHKKAYKAGWLTTPNTYKKKEVDEIGTTTPKKITKWVPETDSPIRPGGGIVKVEHPNQFAPQGENPREFKEKQKSIKKDYYEERITAGPQSRILEGITWDEAQRAKDGQLSGAGDQLIVVGAASKGIIQRDHQHNAVVYRQYYAANPFENMSEAEIDAYQAEVQRRERGELETSTEEEIQAPVVEVPEEGPAPPRRPEPEIQEPEVRYTRAYENISDTPVTSRPRPSQGYSVHEEVMLAQLAEKVVQTVIHDALSVAHRGKGQQILTGADPACKHHVLDHLSVGSQIISDHRHITTHCKPVWCVGSCTGSSNDICSGCHCHSQVRTYANHFNIINHTNCKGLEESTGTAAEVMCSEAETSVLDDCQKHENLIQLTGGHVQRGSYFSSGRWSTMRDRGKTIVEICRGGSNEEFSAPMALGSCCQYSQAGSSSSQQLDSAGSSSQQLDTAGFSSQQLDIAGSSSQQLDTAGSSSQQLDTAGSSSQQLDTAGSSSQQLDTAGSSSQQLDTAGSSSQQLDTAGCSSQQLDTAGCSSQQLDTASCSSQQLETCNCEQLDTAGCSSQQLDTAGCSSQQLDTAGCSSQQLDTAGCSSQQLDTAGCSFECSETCFLDYSKNINRTRHLPVTIKQQPNAQEQPIYNSSLRTDKAFSERFIHPRPDSCIILPQSQFAQDDMKCLPAQACDASVNMKNLKRRHDCLENIAVFTKCDQVTFSFHKDNVHDTILTTTAGSARYKNLLVIDEGPGLSCLDVVQSGERLFRSPVHELGKCQVLPFEYHNLQLDKCIDCVRDNLESVSLCTELPHSAGWCKENPIDNCVLLETSKNAFDTCDLVEHVGFMAMSSNSFISPPVIMVYPVSRVGMPPVQYTTTVQRSSEAGGRSRYETFNRSPNITSRTPGRGGIWGVTDSEDIASKQRWTPKQKHQRRQLDQSLDENVSIISDGTRREERKLLERSFGRQGQQDMDPDEKKLDSLSCEEALRKDREEKRARRNEEARIIYEMRRGDLNLSSSKITGGLKKDGGVNRTHGYEYTKKDRDNEISSTDNKYRTNEDALRNEANIRQSTYYRRNERARRDDEVTDEKENRRDDEVTDEQENSRNQENRLQEAEYRHGSGGERGKKDGHSDDDIETLSDDRSDTRKLSTHDTKSANLSAVSKITEGSDKLIKELKDKIEDRKGRLLEKTLDVEANKMVGEHTKFIEKVDAVSEKLPVAADMSVSQVGSVTVSAKKLQQLVDGSKDTADVKSNDNVSVVSDDTGLEKMGGEDEGRSRRQDGRGRRSGSQYREKSEERDRRRGRQDEERGDRDQYRGKSKERERRRGNQESEEEGMDRDRYRGKSKERERRRGRRDSEERMDRDRYRGKSEERERRRGRHDSEEGIYRDRYRGKSEERDRRRGRRDEEEMDRDRYRGKSKERERRRRQQDSEEEELDRDRYRGRSKEGDRRRGRRDNEDGGASERGKSAERERRRRRDYVDDEVSSEERDRRRGRRDYEEGRVNERYAGKNEDRYRQRGRRDEDRMVSDDERRRKRDEQLDKSVDNKSVDISFDSKQRLKLDDSQMKPTDDRKAEKERHQKSEDKDRSSRRPRNRDDLSESLSPAKDSSGGRKETKDGELDPSDKDPSKKANMDKVIERVSKLSQEQESSASRLIAENIGSSDTVDTQSRVYDYDPKKTEHIKSERGIIEEKEKWRSKEKKLDDSAESVKELVQNSKISDLQKSGTSPARTEQSKRSESSSPHVSGNRPSRTDLVTSGQAVLYTDPPMKELSEIVHSKDNKGDGLQQASQKGSAVIFTNLDEGFDSVSHFPGKKTGTDLHSTDRTHEGGKTEKPVNDYETAYIAPEMVKTDLDVLKKGTDIAGYNNYGKHKDRQERRFDSPGDRHRYKDVEIPEISLTKVKTEDTQKFTGNVIPGITSVADKNENRQRYRGKEIPEISLTKGRAEDRHRHVEIPEISLIKSKAEDRYRDTEIPEISLTKKKGEDRYRDKEIPEISLTKSEAEDRYRDKEIPEISLTKSKAEDRYRNKEIPEISLTKSKAEDRYRDKEIPEISLTKSKAEDRYRNKEIPEISLTKKKAEDRYRNKEIPEISLTKSKAEDRYRDKEIPEISLTKNKAEDRYRDKEIPEISLTKNKAEDRYRDTEIPEISLAKSKAEDRYRDIEIPEISLTKKKGEDRYTDKEIPEISLTKNKAEDRYRNKEIPEISLTKKKGEDRYTDKEIPEISLTKKKGEDRYRDKEIPEISLTKSKAEDRYRDKEIPEISLTKSKAEDRYRDTEIPEISLTKSKAEDRYRDKEIPEISLTKRKGEDRYRNKEIPEISLTKSKAEDKYRDKEIPEISRQRYRGKEIPEILSTKGRVEDRHRDVEIPEISLTKKTTESGHRYRDIEIPNTLSVVGKTKDRHRYIDKEISEIQYTNQSAKEPLKIFPSEDKKSNILQQTSRKGSYVIVTDLDEGFDPVPHFPGKKIDTDLHIIDRTHEGGKTEKPVNDYETAYITPEMVKTDLDVLKKGTDIAGYNKYGKHKDRQERRFDSPGYRHRYKDVEIPEIALTKDKTESGHGYKDVEIPEISLTKDKTESGHKYKDVEIPEISLTKDNIKDTQKFTEKVILGFTSVTDENGKRYRGKEIPEISLTKGRAEDRHKDVEIPEISLTTDKIKDTQKFTEKVILGFTSVTDENGKRYRGKEIPEISLTKGRAEDKHKDVEIPEISLTKNKTESGHRYKDIEIPETLSIVDKTKDSRRRHIDKEIPEIQYSNPQVKVSSKSFLSEDKKSDIFQQTSRMGSAVIVTDLDEGFDPVPHFPGKKTDTDLHSTDRTHEGGKTEKPVNDYETAYIAPEMVKTDLDVLKKGTDISAGYNKYGKHKDRQERRFDSAGNRHRYKDVEIPEISLTKDKIDDTQRLTEKVIPEILLLKDNDEHRQRYRDKEIPEMFVAKDTIQDRDMNIDISKISSTKDNTESGYRHREIEIPETVSMMDKTKDRQRYIDKEIPEVRYTNPSVKEPLKSFRSEDKKSDILQQASRKGSAVIVTDLDEGFDPVPQFLDMKTDTGFHDIRNRTHEGDKTKKPDYETDLDVLKTSTDRMSAGYNKYGKHIGKDRQERRLDSAGDRHRYKDVETPEISVKQGTADRERHREFPELSSATVETLAVEVLTSPVIAKVSGRAPRAVPEDDASDDEELDKKKSRETDINQEVKDGYTNKRGFAGMKETQKRTNEMEVNKDTQTTKFGIGNEGNNRADSYKDTFDPEVYKEIKARSLAYKENPTKSHAYKADRISSDTNMDPTKSHAYKADRISSDTIMDPTKSHAYKADRISSDTNKEETKSDVYKEDRCGPSNYKENVPNSDSYKDDRKSSGAYKDRAKSHVSTEDRAKFNISTKDIAKSHVSAKDRAKFNVSTKDIAKSHVSTEDRAKFNVTAEDRAKSHVSTEDRAKFNVSTKDIAKSHVSAEDRAKFNVSTKDIAKSHVSAEDRAKSHVTAEDRAKSHVSAEDRARSDTYTEDKHMSGQDIAKSGVHSEDRYKSDDRGRSDVHQVDQAMVHVHKDDNHQINAYKDSRTAYGSHKEGSGRSDTNTEVKLGTIKQDQVRIEVKGRSDDSKENRYDAYSKNRQKLDINREDLTRTTKNNDEVIDLKATVPTIHKTDAAQPTGKAPQIFQLSKSPETVTVTKTLDVTTAPETVQVSRPTEAVKINVVAGSVPDSHFTDEKTKDLHKVDRTSSSEKILADGINKISESSQQNRKDDRAKFTKRTGAGESDDVNNENRIRNTYKGNSGRLSKVANETTSRFRHEASKLYPADRDEGKLCDVSNLQGVSVGEKKGVDKRNNQGHRSIDVALESTLSAREEAGKQYLVRGDRKVSDLSVQNSVGDQEIVDKRFLKREISLELASEAAAKAGNRASKQLSPRGEQRDSGPQTSSISTAANEDRRPNKDVMTRSAERVPEASVRSGREAERWRPVQKNVGSLSPKDVFDDSESNQHKVGRTRPPKLVPRANQARIEAGAAHPVRRNERVMSAADVSNKDARRPNQDSRTRPSQMNPGPPSNRSWRSVSEADVPKEDRRLIDETVKTNFREPDFTQRFMDTDDKNTFDDNELSEAVIRPQEKQKYAGFVKRTGRGGRKSLPLRGVSLDGEDTDIIKRQDDKLDELKIEHTKGDKSKTTSQKDEPHEGIIRDHFNTVVHENPIEVTVDDDDNPPQPSPKKGIFSLFGCVAGKSADLVRMLDRSKKKRPTAYYEEGEKRKIKKLSKEKGKEEKKVLYFEKTQETSEDDDDDWTDDTFRTSDEEEFPEATRESPPPLPVVEEKPQQGYTSVRYNNRPPPFKPSKPLSTFIDPSEALEAIEDSASDKDEVSPTFIGRKERLDDDSPRVGQFQTFMSFEQPTVTVKRAESTKDPKFVEQLERQIVERSKSERRPKLREELREGKPSSPSKSDTLKSTDSASGGETLEERSSKEGSPTKELPSPTKEKKKKKKFRIPSFSKKKSKESKESAI